MSTMSGHSVLTRVSPLNPVAVSFFWEVLRRSPFIIIITFYYYYYYYYYHYYYYYYFILALGATTDREKTLAEVYEEIERDLEVLGGTAIEDKLQDGVPETIAILRAAGIKVWMLTGDKQETAINIGHTCNLFGPDTQTIIIEGSRQAEVKAQMETLIRDLPSMTGEYGLVIEGKTLTIVLRDHALPFLDLCCRCAAVICCRVSPQQKASVVALVKNNRKVITLAVGDGANDVSMIQEANIGVGISGLEGKQAVMASDYAIARFQFLRKLLLVHGRWCYLRCARMTMIFFFKNFVFVMPLVWYQIVCGFSSQMVYHFSNQMFYNLLFTSLPVIVLAALDQDISPEYTYAFPTLFQAGIRRIAFNRLAFWFFMLDGLWQGTMCFLFPLLIYGTAEASTIKSGHMPYMYQMGAVMIASVVCSSNLTVAFLVRSFFLFLFFSFFPSSLIPFF